MITNNKRNSNVELLRIVAMFLIVAFHGTRQININNTSNFYLFASKTLIGSWGILGADLFLLISVWFLVDKKFSSKRVFSIIVHTFIYIFLFSIVGTIIKLIDGYGTIDVFINYVYNFILDLFDHFICNYWYVRAYLIMLIVSPLLNKVIRYLDKPALKKMLVIFAFIPILSQKNTSYVNDAIYFCYIYLFIGYIKRHGSFIYEKASWKRAIIVTCLIVIGKLISFIKIDNITIQNVVSLILGNTIACTSRHSLIVLLDALMIFFSVIKLEPKQSTIINNISSLTFGVYLFHESESAHIDNSLDMIVKFFKEIGYIDNSLLFPLEYLSVILLVFIVGCIVEIFINRLIYSPLFNYSCSKLSKNFEKIDKFFEI